MFEFKLVRKMETFNSYMFQDFKDVRHSLNSDRPFINMYKKTKKNIDYLMYLQQCFPQ